MAAVVCIAAWTPAYFRARTCIAQGLDFCQGLAHLCWRPWTGLNFRPGSVLWGRAERYIQLPNAGDDASANDLTVFTNGIGFAMDQYSWTGARSAAVSYLSPGRGYH